MVRLRELGLLQCLGIDNSDYDWVSQLQPHQLSRWAFTSIKGVTAIALKELHSSEECLSLHMQPYTKYREHDL